MSNGHVFLFDFGDEYPFTLWGGAVSPGIGVQELVHVRVKCGIRREKAKNWSYWFVQDFSVSGRGEKDKKDKLQVR